jgi:glyoxylase-like metal-dependent hydrolase (beta-lactamase superfamily II)
MCTPITSQVVVLELILRRNHRNSLLLKLIGSGKLKQLLSGALSAISALSEAQADVLLRDGDALTFGSRTLYAVSTPGHTAVCRVNR